MDSLFVLFEKQVQVEQKPKGLITKENLQIVQDAETCEIFLCFNETKIPLTKSVIVMKLPNNTYNFVHQSSFNICTFGDSFDISVFEAIISTITTFRVLEKKVEPVLEKVEKKIITPSFTEKKTEEIFFKNLEENYQEKKEIPKDDYIFVSQDDVPLPDHLKPIEILSFPDRILSTVDGATGYLSSSIKSGSQKVGNGVRYTGDYIKSKVESSNIQVPTIIKWGISGVETVVTGMSTYSGNAITNVLNTGTGAITGGVARITRWLPDHPSENFRTMRRVTIESVKKVGNFVGEATESVKKVIVDTSETTYDVIHHKYGEDVKEITKSGINITKGAIETYLNVSGVSAQANALVAAKNATFQIMEDCSKK